MTLQLALAANVLLLAAMIVSIVRFLWAAAAEQEHRGPRLMAALTSLLTLLAACLIYTAEFRRVVLGGIARWHRPGLYDRVADVTAAADRFFVWVGHWATFGDHVTLQRHPPLWPALLLGAAYALRFLIYSAIFRRRFADANVTGSVIWSHMTAYGMVIAFALIVPKWPLWLVLPAAVIVLLLLATVLIGIFTDSLALVAGYVNLLLGAAYAFLQEVARAAVWFAGLVKETLEQAKRWYDAHVSARIRRHAERMTSRSAALREASTRHLEQQNRSHRERFTKERKGERGEASLESPSVGGET